MVKDYKYILFGIKKKHIENGLKELGAIDPSSLRTARSGPQGTTATHHQQALKIC